MSRSRLITGRAVVAVATMSIAAAVLAAPVSAAPSGTVGVTGGSASKIELTIGDATAAFGSNLTPDGDASNSTDTVTANVDPAGTSTGTCYEWGSLVTVRSNKVYDLKASAAATNTKLNFLTSNPATFAACAGGEQFSTAMFPGATPPSSWAVNQVRTASATHNYWLGLEIIWADDPSATVGVATLTLSATAAS